MELFKGSIVLVMESRRVPQDAEERIREAGGGRELHIVSKGRELEGLLDNIEIAFGDVPFSLAARMPRLAWLQLWSAGADQLQRHPELKTFPFILTSASGIHGGQMAEHIFALILAWDRFLPAAFEAKKKHEWRRFSEYPVRTLKGRNMLIMGYGSIGEAVARTALAFGMNVTGLRRSVSKSASAGGLVIESASRLRELLPASDYVVNILPATPETFHIFGKTEFGLMRQSAVYINAGRGTTTDEAAMTEALKSRSIAGALLDVTETEPLPPDSLLWDLDNVLLTSHYAGMHPRYGELALDLALDNLRRYVRGEALRNVIDKERGY
jgi:phosphoglycerate dehydrogenase-like enzyme